MATAVVGAVSATGNDAKLCRLTKTQCRRAQRAHTLACLRAGVMQRAAHRKENDIELEMYASGEADLLIRSVAVHRSDCHATQTQHHYAATSNLAAIHAGHKSKCTFKEHRTLHQQANAVKHEASVKSLPVASGDMKPPMPPPLLDSLEGCGTFPLNDPAIMYAARSLTDLNDILHEFLPRPVDVEPTAFNRLAKPFVPFSGTGHHVAVPVEEGKIKYVVIPVPFQPTLSCILPEIVACDYDFDVFASANAMQLTQSFSGRKRTYEYAFGAGLLDSEYSDQSIYDLNLTRAVLGETNLEPTCSTADESPLHTVKVMADDDNMLISAMPFCMKRYSFVKTTTTIRVGSHIAQSEGEFPYDCNQQWNKVSNQLVFALGL